MHRLLSFSAETKTNGDPTSLCPLNGTLNRGLMRRSESERLGCESGQPLRERRQGLSKRRRMFKGSVRGLHGGGETCTTHFSRLALSSLENDIRK